MDDNENTRGGAEAESNQEEEDRKETEGVEDGKEEDSKEDAKKKEGKGDDNDKKGEEGVIRPDPPGIKVIDELVKNDDQYQIKLPCFKGQYT